MASLKSVIEGACVSNLRTVTEQGSEKYVCFTGFEGEKWHVSATDGSLLWKLELNEDGIDEIREDADISTVDTLLAKTRFKFFLNESIS